MLKLREYQQEALQAAWDAWGRGVVRPAVVLPTGMGKTVIFAHLIKDAHAAGVKAIILVHRDELVQQAAQKIHSVAPNMSIGIVKASRNETDADVIIASVQTLARESRRVSVTGIGLVIVDECHHAVARTYKDVLTHFGCFDSTPAIGFTATLERADRLGLGDVWQEVAYKRDILYGIRCGYLTDVKGLAVTVEDLELDDVSQSRGDYQEGALGSALLEANSGYYISRAYKEHAANRQGILFAPTVDSAYQFAADLNSSGIKTEVIAGHTPLEDRVLIYKKYREGEIQVLSNCMVLTEGFDMPQASCAVIARPTQSNALYVQMVGRVLRPWPGKADALVLDVVGVTGNMRLASIASLSETTIKIKPEETLAQAAARSEGEIQEAAEKKRGNLTATQVDLFDRSHSAWLQTYQGKWFIPTRDHTFFIWPEPEGTYKVGQCGAHNTQGGIWHVQGVTIEYAMAWAEQLAEETDPMVASRNSSWRRKKQKPSQPQKDLAMRLGLSIEDGMTKNEVSNLISVHFASRLLDRKRNA